MLVVEMLLIMLAYEHGEISERQAYKILGFENLVTFRDLHLRVVADAKDRVDRIIDALNAPQS